MKCRDTRSKVCALAYRISLLVGEELMPVSDEEPKITNARLIHVRIVDFIEDSVTMREPVRREHQPRIQSSLESAPVLYSIPFDHRFDFI
jgi:hypothetical protein